MKSTSELSHDKTKETKNRFEGAFDDARCSTDAGTAHLEGLGMSPGRARDAFGQLLVALGTPGTFQDRLGGGIWASKSRPKRVRTRPRNGLGRPNQPEIFFFVDFGFIFVDV